MDRRLAALTLLACDLLFAGCQQAQEPVQTAGADVNAAGDTLQTESQPVATGSAATTSPEPASRPGEDSVQAHTYVVVPGADVQFELQARLIEAVPGDTIQLEAGRYELHRQLDVAADNVTIRGRGADQTVLTYKGLATSGQGLEVTGNNFVLEDLAIEDTPGNAVKVVGSRNVTFRGVRVEWTGEPTSANGAYGLYPVQCDNVLLENCTAIGASDAGIYVGQCRNVIVRSCRAERNVAGIEIENTIGADVYENVATNNAGGLLVFDMAGLPQKAAGMSASTAIGS
jgi:parallel beta-helix repeat protein